MANVTIKVAGHKWTLTSVLLEEYCSRNVTLIKKINLK
jgi:hypothetical protein